ncbi:hypothetical protein EGM63_15030 [Mycobacterium avium subsp. paratuberculosis]|nr:hypothetical protein CEP84_22915 [Mycobacterium avium subsp. paratuberculosis]AYQ67287.1 hypothetical protein EC390_02815 [Mycobacterium avium subsp. paratuberculosis]AYQ79294.1 hypothetical protein EC391_19925 [Mycobacterium avium subsp. paratuberculosis]AZA70507.1 hypothetical protein EGM63_15030 [Mycobacterium avium subsp. paratuberculosis]AZB14979.1 hypothetical protein EGM64_17500 [Mycobacterium avium subsp. paratuberculosis]
MAVTRCARLRRACDRRAANGGDPLRRACDHRAATRARPSAMPDRCRDPAGPRPWRPDTGSTAR